MTITAAELLIAANLRTGRSETDIDTFIKAWVNDLSIRGVVLEAEQSISLVDDTPNYDISSYRFQNIEAVMIIDSDGDENGPLTEISWLDYKKRLSGGGLSKDYPSKYCIFNDTLYLSPAPNATSYPSMKVSGKTDHADSATITYPNRYRECGIEFICFKIYENYGMASSEGKPHFDLYELEANKILAYQSRKNTTPITYTDI